MSAANASIVAHVGTPSSTRGAPAASLRRKPPRRRARCGIVPSLVIPPLTSDLASQLPEIRPAQLLDPAPPVDRAPKILASRAVRRRDGESPGRDPEPGPGEGHRGGAGDQQRADERFLGGAAVARAWRRSLGALRTRTPWHQLAREDERVVEGQLQTRRGRPLPRARLRLSPFRSSLRRHAVGSIATPDRAVAKRPLRAVGNGIRNGNHLHVAAPATNLAPRPSPLRSPR
jgi:hypothetical protein